MYVQLWQKTGETLGVKRSNQRNTRGGPGYAYPRQAALISREERANLETRSFLQGAISVFILFHLVSIICWTVPTDSALIQGVRELVGPYMQWTALSQSWDTFAPNPESVNAYIKAAVITQNGHMHVWTFPRMEQLNFSKRYRKERYRKFAENLVEEKNAAILPDVARHVARLYKNPADPPDKVLLIQFHADITPGADKEYAQTPRPRVFYEDYVEPEDLR